MGASKQSYEDLQMGFDRTQLYKEFTQPQINRSAALQAVMNFCKINQIKMSNVEIVALTKKYLDFIETGDTSWAKIVDKYLMDKYEEI
jgi:chromatin segregation and condensation protein Rec8/ScpA/Scc1 (kleisin family)